VASVAAGVKFAETNAGNAESIRDFEKALKGLFSGESEFGAWLGKIQADFQVLISRVIQAASGIEAFNEAVLHNDWAGASKALDDITSSTKGVSEEMRVAEKAQADAQQQAIGAAAAEAEQKKGTDAHKDSVKSLADEFKKLTSVEQIHGAILALGVEGQAIWSQLNVTSTTTLEKLRKKLEDYDKSFAKATETVKAHEQVLKDQIEAEKSLIKAQSDEIAKIDEVVRSVNSEEGARKRLHETQMGELSDMAKHEVAVDGTSKSIEDVAGHVRDLAAAYDANGPAITDEIARLDALGKSTLDLSAETRHHIDAVTAAGKQVADLTAKNHELEASAAALISSGKTQTAAGFAEYEALQKQIRANEDLIARGKEIITTQSAQISGTKEGTTEWIRGADAQKKSADAAGGLVDASGKIVESLGEIKLKGDPASHAIADVGTAAEKAKTPAEIFSGVMADIAKGAKETAPALDPMLTKLAELTTKLNEATTAGNSFNSTMAAMDAATKKAAGDSVGINGKNTSGAGPGNPYIGTSEGP
jgi:chromosome segregation ATPase